VGPTEIANTVLRLAKDLASLNAAQRQKVARRLADVEDRTALTQQLWGLQDQIGDWAESVAAAKRRYVEEDRS
jgi:hypothetical protein